MRRAATLRAMLILAIIVIGMAAGWIAQLVLSRDTGNRGEALAAGLIGTVLGAIVVLAIWGAVRGKSPSAGRSGR